MPRKPADLASASARPAGPVPTSPQSSAALTIVRGTPSRATAPIRRHRTPAQERVPSRRLVLVANRLPMTLSVGADGVRVSPSGGGLATGLAGVHERSDSVWVGWSGVASDEPAAAPGALDAQLRAHGAVGVPLERYEVDAFYRRYCNGVLWPVLHGVAGAELPGRWDWITYQRVNQRFARTVAEHARDGDHVWVHDYHLLLVPQLLRTYLPSARIGLFLHTPFPEARHLDRLRPEQRRALLEGIRGADLIGFHTAGDAARYAEAIATDDLWRSDRSAPHHDFGSGHVGVFPMGIDAQAFAARANAAHNADAVHALRSAGGPLFVGVDRLDYTKGIPERLEAFGQLLDRVPALRGHARLYQLAVPSREDVPAYRALRERVASLVRRINQRLQTPGWTPIEYVYGSVDAHRLAALYCAADVMLVTPIRDGMNLVAKEFVASRTDGDGVLVLSEHAGASVELGAALLVEPCDVDALSAAYERALTMSPAERRVRMRHLRAVVMSHDVFQWSDTFLSALDRCAGPSHLSFPSD